MWISVIFILRSMTTTSSLLSSTDVDFSIFMAVCKEGTNRVGLSIYMAVLSFPNMKTSFIAEM